MQLAEVFYEDIFNNLPKEKQSELIGRKATFTKKAGVTLLNEFHKKKMLYVERRKIRKALCMIYMQGFS